MLGDASGEMGDNLPAVDLGTGRTAIRQSPPELTSVVQFWTMPLSSAGGEVVSLVRAIPTR